MYVRVAHRFLHGAGSFLPLTLKRELLTFMSYWHLLFTDVQDQPFYLLSTQMPDGNRTSFVRRICRQTNRASCHSLLRGFMCAMVFDACSPLSNCVRQSFRWSVFRTSHYTCTSNIRRFERCLFERRPGVSPDTVTAAIMHVLHVWALGFAYLFVAQNHATW